MNKNTSAAPARQQQENPLVRIVYDPEDALARLGGSMLKTITRVATVVKITNAKELESASMVLSDAEIEAERINVFLAGLRERVQDAAERFTEIEGFEGFQVTLTVRKWPKWNQLQDGISAIKRKRAEFNDAEARRIRQAQADADAKQREINEKAARDAAAAAKKAGADAATVKEIKQEVLATPAPIVESKAQQLAQDLGAGLRYKWTAKITSLKSFLGFCLNNPVMLATLSSAIPDIEKAFGKMASDQKEQFNFPGITFVKTPVDVSRGGR